MNINSVLEKYKSLAENKKYREGVDRRKVINEHMRGYHWGEDLDFSEVLPSLQFTWLAVEVTHPKIFNGYSFKPEVVPESYKNYPIDPDSELRKYLAALSIDNTTDSVKEAKILSAIADRLWEKADGLYKIKEAVRGALWYGEYFVIDGWDNGPFIDLVHPDFVRKDPDAKCLDESRFVAYFVTRSKEELKDQYREFADKIDELPSEEGKTDDNLTLECWFIRDYSKKIERIEKKISPDELQKHLDDGFVVVEEITEMVPQPINPFMGNVPQPPSVQPPIESMQPPQVPPEQQLPPELAQQLPPELQQQVLSIPQVVGYVVAKEEEKPAFRGGWRHIKRVGDVILYDGENPSATGNLPLHWIPCYKIPGEFEAQGIPDQVKDLNYMVDLLSYEAYSYVRKAKPGIAMKEGVFIEEGVSTLTTEGQDLTILKVAADEDTPLGAAMMPIAFPELSQSHQIMIDRYVDAIEQITGSTDLRGANVAYDSLSGEAVEKVETAANARNTEFRDNVRKVIANIIRNMVANAQKYADEVLSIEIIASNKPLNLEVDPTEFDTDRFEANFDVVVGSTDTLPPTGKARNRVILESVSQLAQFGPQLGLRILDVLELPEKATIKAALQEHFEAMQQQPEQQDDKQSEVIKRFGESLSDSLEEIAKDDKIPIEYRLRALKAIQLGAAGQPIPPIEEIFGG